MKPKNITLRNPNPLLAANELVVIIGFSIVGQSVIVFVNIATYNFRQFSVQGVVREQLDSRVTMAIGFSLNCHSSLSTVRNIGKFFHHI